jgi:peroxiredoxin
MPRSNSISSTKRRLRGKRKYSHTVVEAFHRSTAELIASGQAERALKAGNTAPSFTLLDLDGTPASSAGLLARGLLVVTFYRGFWCTYCNMDLKALEAAAGDIRARGASLVAISEQTPANSRKSQAQNKLSYPILTDQGCELAVAYGIYWDLPEYLQDVFKMFGLDLRAIHGDPHWTLPMPGRYVIGTDGIIAYAEVNHDYTRRPEPSELLPTLDRLKHLQTA